MALPPRIDLMGVPIDAYTPEALIAHLVQQSLSGRGGYVMTANLDHLRTVTRNAAMRSLAMQADIRVADGVPLIWASRLQRTPLPSRVAGSDLIHSLTNVIARNNLSVFLIGGSPGTADAAAEVLRRQEPSLTVAGTHYPPLGFEGRQADLDAICTALQDAEPAFVYVGLPFPKASALVEAARSHLPSAWFIGMGISFSFVSGEVARAPVWMQRAGLEWSHRLAQEPSRLFRRYVLEGIPFAIRLLSGAAITRFRSQSPADAPRPGPAR